MTFHDPWIDPRILELHLEAVRAYLLRNDWEFLGPAAVPDMLMFDTPNPRGDKPNVLLPLKLEYPEQVQRMVELVGDVALYERRWAVDVLSDMLRQPIDSAPPELREAANRDAPRALAGHHDGRLPPRLVPAHPSGAEEMVPAVRRSATGDEAWRFHSGQRNGDGQRNADAARLTAQEAEADGDRGALRAQRLSGGRPPKPRNRPRPCFRSVPNVCKDSSSGRS